MPANITCQRVVEQVTAHQESALHAFAERAIDEHLAACDCCSAYYAQVDRTIDLLGCLEPQRTIAPEARTRLLAEFASWSAIRSLRG
jgi:predicted anti-sigma-YlaC factor YlaD